METRLNRFVWGKWCRDTQEGLLLSSHCLDVAIVFRELVLTRTLGARLAMGCGSTLDHVQISRLAVLAFLHDLGKCNWGFQAKADPAARDTAGHALEAITLLLDEELRGAWPEPWSELISNIVTWFTQGDEGALQMLVAAISHHGRPISMNDYAAQGGHRLTRFWKPRAGYDPMQSLAELALAVRQAFSEAFEPEGQLIAATPQLQQRFAGLVMLADWIGSDKQFFAYRTTLDGGRQTFAQRAARRALAAIGLHPPAPRRAKPFGTVFSFIERPTALQDLLANALPIDDAVRLVLAESDTGSGKTEAALSWFLRLYAGGHVDGLYFALPTRVAARELYGRVCNAIAAAFEPALHPSPVLLAVPGYVRADGEPILPEPDGILWDDDPRAHRRARLWSAERPKRFLAASVAVGTIDQALLSVLRVKHSLLRSVCLDRHLLVVDEVHASDPYMREVLRTLLRGHVDRGGWALLLSATLGESAACAFFDYRMRSIAEAQARPYPSVTTRMGERPVASSRTPRTIEITLSPTLLDDAALLPQMVGALARGARVLVVCNTVGRANALLRALEGHFAATNPELLDAVFALYGVACPHHGRFARDDRERLDAAVSARLGRDSAPGPLLLVGTQTLEQSLDIDADWLITDLAPMDVLLQRLGRLHRHPRTGRPAGFNKPRALVRIPEKPLLSYLGASGELRAPAGLGSVYTDGRVLQCTLTCLEAHPRLRIPQDNRPLIEQTTHPGAWAGLGDGWKRHGEYMDGVFLADVRAADGVVLPNDPFGELHYNTVEEQVLTRLGDPTYELPLVDPLISPFGVRVERVILPARWLRNVPVPEAVAPMATGDGFRFEVQGLAFRYTRYGLEKDDA